MINIVTQQVRRGVFETNSSSTHTITITDNAIFQPKPLLEGKILYPARLNYTHPFIGLDHYNIQIRTYLEKISLYCLWLNDLTGYDYNNVDIKPLYQMIKDDAGIDEIVFLIDTSIVHYDTYGESNFDSFDYFTSKEGFQKLLDIANDDTKGFNLKYEQN